MYILFWFNILKTNIGVLNCIVWCITGHFGPGSTNPATLATVYYIAKDETKSFMCDSLGRHIGQDWFRHKMLNGSRLTGWYHRDDSLQWHHSEHDRVSNQRRFDCLLSCFSGPDQRKHQSSASLAVVREIHRSPVNSPRKGPVTLCFDWEQKIYIYCVAVKSQICMCVVALMIKTYGC